MKSNCSLVNEYDLSYIVAAYLEKNRGCRISYKSDSCFIGVCGIYHFTMWNEQTERFDIVERFTADELAKMAGCETCEFVSTGAYDNDNIDAALFYTEK